MSPQDRSTAISAAEHHPRKTITVVHTERVTRPAEKQSPTTTTTVTMTSTCYLNDACASQELPTSTDPYITTPLCSTATSTPGNIVPYIQGIVPGIQRAPPEPHSHSPPHSPQRNLALKSPILKPTLARQPTPSETLHPTAGCARCENPRPKRSTYPRPSPPGFLYPTPIVPHLDHSTANVHAIQSTETRQHTQHSSIMTRVDYEITYLPTGLKLVFLVSLVFLALGTIWAVVVWCVTFPPGKWAVCRYIDGKGNGKKERRPIDKPSKYVQEMESWQQEEEEEEEEEEGGRTSAIPQQPFWYPLNENNEEEVVRRRRCGNQTHHRHHRTSSSSSSSHTTRLHLSSPPASNTTTTTASGPINPFLIPPTTADEPLKNRTSNEWLTEREKFFTPIGYKAPPPPPPASASPLPPASYSLATSEIEALEAGTAPLTSYPICSSASSSSTSSDGSNKGGEGKKSTLRKRLSWFDQGLEMVDGAVGSVTSGLARWTDDLGNGNGSGGEDAGLVLPVARG